jgi:hypothetical protein
VVECCEEANALIDKTCRSKFGFRRINNETPIGPGLLPVAEKTLC